MSTGYDNNNREGGQPGSGGWTPYQGEQGRQEFFQRYNSVFQQPSGSYQGSYSTPTPPPAYQPQPPVKEKKRRSGSVGRIAGVMAACMVISVAGGAVGAWGFQYLSQQEGTVFYQAVRGDEVGSTGGDGITAPLPEGTQAGYTGGALSVQEIAALASPSVVEIRTE